MTSKPTSKLTRLMEQLPKELESIFSASAKSNHQPLKSAAEKGFVYHDIEAKKALFIGLNHVPETGALFPEKALTTVQGQKRDFIQKIATAIGMKDQWTFMNLLFTKVKQREDVLKLQAEKEGMSFLIAQLQLSMELIEAIQPEIIFLMDPTAVNLFRAGEKEKPWMGYICAYDNRFGVHVIKDVHPSSLKIGDRATALQGIPAVFMDSTEPLEPFTFQRFTNHLQQILWVYSLHFGKEYPGNPGNILQAFVDWADDIDEWTRIQNYYVAQMDYYGSAEGRDRIREYFDKIEVVLAKILRWNRTS